MSDDVISLSEIQRRGSLLGAGGQAQVYFLPDLKLPDVVGPLVFKKYRTGQEPPQGLRKIVRFRNELDPTTRHRLDSCTVWPLRVVEERAHQICGIILPLIPEVFFHTLTLPGSGQSVRPARGPVSTHTPNARADHRCAIAEPCGSPFRL
jgi:hypothetical protein